MAKAKKITTAFYVCFSFEDYTEDSDPMRDEETQVVTGRYTSRERAEQDTLKSNLPAWMVETGAVFVAIVQADFDNGQSVESVLWAGRAA